MEEPSGIKEGITVEEVSFYYEEMVRAHLLELEIETAEGRIVLKRSHGQTLGEIHPFRRRTDFLPPGLPPAGAAPAAPGASAPARPSAPPAAQTINSPITGIFYRSPSPQSPPFIKEGDTVNPGATLCIVEAMKVMNEIKADGRFRILKFLVENGKPVNSGQPLFEVERG